MTTITELANAIDGYNIFQEQQRCYNAKAECDNKIIRRQLAEGVEVRVISDLHQYQTNAQNQVNKMISNIARKQTHIDVDLADNMGGSLMEREVTIGYLRGCMRGRTLEWFDEEIITKQNWELANLLDNTEQTNLLRVVKDPWNENWHIASGHPTNIAVNTLNANNSTTVVVADALLLPWLEKAEDIALQQQGISLEDMQKAIQNVLVYLIRKIYRWIPKLCRHMIILSSSDPNLANKGSLDTSHHDKSNDKHVYDIISPFSDSNLINKDLLDPYHLDESNDSDYPIKSFQRSHPQRSNISTRIERIEEEFNETWDTLGSKFSNINNLAIKALGWKADKLSNFTIKDNSKHITNSLGWYTDMPVTLKDKEDKMITVIRNFIYIDNSETKLMLFFGISNIRKVQDIIKPNKNQFRIKLYGKAYIIPIFSKAAKTLVAKDMPKED
ncbi:hypothetical protein C1645_833599 [Glomus cerebriforme]|uniref:Uncharacterized protein n=1 Tax=Glomus cerebriforme TaxID=658196 RepID=A0A397SFE7_9GLOM|nr:hypothetical protein C1645_833599 [Glomus cerebriforme]